MRIGTGTNNPAWGRFVSEDPIGLRGGINVSGALPALPPWLFTDTCTPSPFQPTPPTSCPEPAGPMPPCPPGVSCMSNAPPDQNGSPGAPGKPIPPEGPPYSYTPDTLAKMNNRGISPQDVNNALGSYGDAYNNPESGNDVFVGNNGVTVIVDPVSGEIVSTFRPGAR